MKVIVLGDIHAPLHHKKAWFALLNLIKQTKPDRVIQLGDAADFEAVSAHPAKLGKRRAFERELAQARITIHQLLAAQPKNVTILQGNHEERLERYIVKNAPALEGVVETGKGILNLPDWVEWVPYLSSYHIGRVTFVHDVGYSGAQATRQTLAAVGHCVVHGHTHRAEITYDGQTDGDRQVAMGCGWLGDVSKITYAHPSKTRAWQLGFGEIDFVDGLAWMQFHPYVRGRFFYQGKVFK